MPRKILSEEHASRRSRRVQGLVPSANTSPPKAVYLPMEIRLLTLGYLEKKDLKQVRLVAKDWCEISTAPLFDTIYISPHERDVEVWKEMTGHPVISGVVRRLVYDTASFRDDLSYEDYWAELFRNFLYIAYSWQDTPFNSPDVEINSLIEQYKGTIDQSTDQQGQRNAIRSSHQHDVFVFEGYQEHRKNAAYEFRVLASEVFSADLCKGILQLSGLREIYLSDLEWRYDLMDNRSMDSSSFYGPDKGSPLARSWHPFHLRPKSTSDLRNGRCHVFNHFQTLTAALAKRDRGVTTFKFNDGPLIDGLPAFALTRSVMSHTRLNQILAAYSSLEYFDISITTYPEEEPDNPQLLNTLPILLSRMSNLKSLYLDLDETAYMSPTRSYLYPQVFPVPWMSPKLTTLSIRGLAVRAVDFITMVWKQPQLRHLVIAHINLLEGSWEGTLFGLRCKQLDSLRFIGRFSHHGATKFPPELPEYDWDRERERLSTIEDYVVIGGRHPCLPPNSPLDAPLRCFADMLPDEAKREAGLIIHEFACELKKHGLWHR